MTSFAAEISEPAVATTIDAIDGQVSEAADISSSWERLQFACFSGKETHFALCQQQFNLATGNRRLPEKRWRPTMQPKFGMCDDTMREWEVLRPGFL
jgi:hypothetical protein